MLAFAVFILGVCLLVYRLLQVGKRDPRMPPGPPTVPLLGNAHQIPATGLYKQMREWAQQYGSVFSLKVGPSSIVVLCDRKAIHKLLVEKGSIYSDRPPSYVGHLLTQGDHLALEQMDATWREKRKVISHNFSPKQLDENHFRVQESEATVLMTNLLQNPDNFYQDVRRYTASVVTSITYGFRAASFDSFWGHVRQGPHERIQLSGMREYMLTGAGSLRCDGQGKAPTEKLRHASTTVTNTPT